MEVNLKCPTTIEKPMHSWLVCLSVLIDHKSLQVTLKELTSVRQFCCPVWRRAIGELKKTITFLDHRIKQQLSAVVLGLKHLIKLWRHLVANL